MRLGRLLLVALSTSRSAAFAPASQGARLTARWSSRGSLEAMTVVQLKELLREKELKVGGKKADLVARLLGDEVAASAGDASSSPAVVGPAVLIEACKS